ncbi:HAD-IIA family hydrolase [Marinicaulis aureus]|uniref:HAD-IIA family hydrolase n=1 Tax=Hyphococcus aureus TaxID=2666033 RepID=A0ABW1KXE5_9PROT
MPHELNAAEGFIFDMDGTLVLGDKASAGHVALPGAIETLKFLRERGVPFQVFTNGTARTPDWYANSMRKAGLDVRDEEFMTPSTSAAHYLKEKGAERILVLGKEPVWKPLTDLGLNIVEAPGDGGPYDAIYVGWFREFTFPDLEATTHAIWAGAQLTTASDVPFFAAAGAEKRGIGTSFAINAMLKALTGAEAHVLGKPSLDALQVAKARMGLSPDAKIVVVGDDPQLEARMANEGGAFSVGVATGIYDEAAFRSREDPLERPELLLSGIDKLAALLREGA